MSKEQSAWGNLPHQAHTVAANKHSSRLQPSCCHPSVGVTCRQCSKISRSPYFNCSLLFWLVSTTSHSEATLLLYCPFPGHRRASSHEVLDTSFFLVVNATLTTEAVWPGKCPGEVTKDSALFLTHYFSPASLRWTWVSNILLFQIFNSFHRH